MVLYLAEYGYDDAPVGEDLMEWLNIHFIEPSTEEGDHLSALNCPWEDETFWPYLTRYGGLHLFFLHFRLTDRGGRHCEDFPRHPPSSSPVYRDILLHFSKRFLRS